MKSYKTHLETLAVPPSPDRSPAVPTGTPEAPALSLAPEYPADNIAALLEEAQSAIDLIGAFVDKPYYEILNRLPIVPCEQESIEAAADTAWLYKITRLAYEKDNRDFEQRLGNVISAVGLCGGTLIMRIDYNPPGITIYIGVSDKRHNTSITTLKDTLHSSFLGNFQGSELESVPYNGLCSMMRDCVENSFSYNCVTAVSSMARQNRDQASLMGLENIISASADKPFSLLVLGEPIAREDVVSLRQLYEALATQLSKFVNFTFSQQSGTTVTDGKSVSDSLGLTRNKSDSVTTGTSVTNGTTSGNSSRPNADKIPPAMDAMFSAGKLLAALDGNMMAIWALNATRDGFKNKPDTFVDTNSGKTRSDTVQESQTNGSGEAVSQSRQTSRNTALATNNGFSAQYTMVNHAAKNLYDKIVSYLDWLEKSANYGMFHVCAYVLSASASTGMSVSSQYASMMNGEGIARTYGINNWTQKAGQDVRRYLSVFRHPTFLHPTLGRVNPSVSVSGVELVRNFLLPQSSIGELSVLHCESFGRNVISRRRMGEGSSVVLGCIHHLGRDIPSDPVPIFLDSLSRHTFVGGANGTGKSTALFTLLHKVYKRGIPFMVIEPAKGEYRRVFQSLPGVNIYSPMRIQGVGQLKLNLFWFRDGIDVNEHVEKLVEIFNSCWPMYAAMPQVLREALYNAYEACGWDLENSENPNGRIFPNVEDVCGEIQKMVRNTAFSAEVQGNYIGSLLTRMQSLNMGIYKRIFDSGDMGDEALFESSVILDISRPDAADVKALLMGAVIVRHMEYCLSGQPLGDILRHLTVLEEAHTLLAPRQPASEGADIGNKAIEMMARCIAELGGFGQGFIIADQAPGLLDRSVIRNTNTKLIFQLQDMSDCELTGRAMGLSEEQCAELAELDRGVCAIHQINWEEAVLCHVLPDLPDLSVPGPPAKTESPAPSPPSLTEYLYSLLKPFSHPGKHPAVEAEQVERAREWAVSAGYGGRERLKLVQAACGETREWRAVVDAVKLLGLRLPELDRSDMGEWTEEALAAVREYAPDRAIALTLIEALLDLTSRKNMDDFHSRWFDFIRTQRGQPK